MSRSSCIAVLVLAALCQTTAAQSCDALQACFVRNLATGVETDVTTSNKYPIDTTNKVGYSVRCTLRDSKANYVKYVYDTQSYSAYAEPRWASPYGAGPPEYIQPIPYLATCGTKQVTVSGHTWDQTCFTKTLTLTAQCSGSTGGTASPPAPTPTAVAATPAGATSACDALQSCFVRHLGTGVEVNLSTKSYNIDVTNKLGYSIRCTLTKGTVNYVKFLFDNQSYDAYAEPRWMSPYGTGSSGDYVAPVSYLATCGTKTVRVQGHTWTQICFDTTFAFTAQCNGVAVPKAPAPVSAPKPAPVPVPKSAPAPVPVALPVPAPVPVALSPSAGCGNAAVQSCVVRNLATNKDVSVTIGGSSSASVSYELDTTNKLGYSMLCTMQGSKVNIIKYVFDSVTFEAFAEPYWMSYYGKGSSGSDYIATVPYLSTSCGSKTVKVQGHTWSNQCFETVVTLTAQCNGTPMAVPTTRQVPIAAPAPTPTAPVPAPDPVAPTPVAAVQCPAGFKLVSNACVKESCNDDFVCPPGSGRIPSRDCYKSFNDCQCFADHVQRLGRQQCAKRRRVSFRQCRFGRKWWGACRSQRDKALRDFDRDQAQ